MDRGEGGEEEGVAGLRVPHSQIPGSGIVEVKKQRMGSSFFFSYSLIASKNSDGLSCWQDFCACIS